jgi:ribosome-associated heat shock protein Hsp15
LWATRFFKTRAAAGDACEGGRIKRLGHPLKPASAIHVGDTLEVPFHDGPGTRTVRVVGLPARRGGAPEAQACYLDLTAPEVVEANRVALREKRERMQRDGDQGRPTKRDRREIERFRGFFD